MQSPFDETFKRLFKEASTRLNDALSLEAFQWLVAQALHLLDNSLRLNQVIINRISAALLQISKFSFEHPDNGDEEKYKDQNYIGSYTKALPHNTTLGQPTTGEVDCDAYRQYLKALQVGTLVALDMIPLGGTAKLANPLAAYAFELEGADSHSLTMPAAPTFDSEQEISEIAELYWQALTRDVPFTDYDSNELTKAAAADLSLKFPNFFPRVTTKTLFRSGLPGDLDGPYISQFLWVDVPYGIAAGFPTNVQNTPNNMRGVPVPLLEQRSEFPQLDEQRRGRDFMTNYQEWLNIQNGGRPEEPTILDRNNHRYIHTSRDLAEYVHRDYPYQTFVNACLILLSYGRDALDSANPYLKENTTQSGFGTFGAPDILDLVARVANEAVKAAWYQKWLVHRRLRPEEFGGLLENQRRRLANYPFNPSARPKLDTVLDRVLKRCDSYLLPQAFPEGCPTHPAYPAAHATYAGACVTVLKAFFKEEFEIPLLKGELGIPIPQKDLEAPNLVVANNNGTNLEPYKVGVDGPRLMIGGELNKLASNIAIGRDAAGVHWRSDSIEGLRLGEKVAVCLLQDRMRTYREDFSGYKFTSFCGQKIHIDRNGTITRNSAIITIKDL